MTVRIPGLSGSIYHLEIISLPKSGIHFMKHSKKYLLKKANWKFVSNILQQYFELGHPSHRDMQKIMKSK